MRIRFFRIIFVGLLLASCSSDSGSDDFVGAANVSLSANPNSIDTGDRLLVSAQISEVHENGIILKFRFPAELHYVPSSSKIEVDDAEDDIRPSFNASVEDDSYLVFFIEHDDFGRDAEGKVSFELEGVEKLSQGDIEVDADVDDPLIDDSAEFNVDEPQFAAEDQVEVDIK